jgi:HEAT repeat protein
MTSRTLISWLDAEHPEFRMVAAATLGQIGNERAVRPLLDALTDSSPRVRERAARSCGQLGDRRTVPALIERLDDPELMVRRAAANALGAIGTERALKALVPVARADDKELRRIAVEELGQLGSLEPVVVLLRALTDDSDSVQRTALLSLIQLFVEAPPDQSQEIRDAVADQLERLESEAIVPTLLDVLDESNRLPVRRNGAWLLGRVTGSADTHRDEVYDCLIDLLSDPDEMTADLAAASLTDLGDEDIERRLLILANNASTSAEVAERAERILDDLGGRRELVENSVDYKYVTDPADYTEQKRSQENDDDA